MRDELRLNFLTALSAALVLLGVFGVISVFVPYADGACRKDPWNWEYDCPASKVEERKAILAAEHAG